eukprot:CAMPEP_0175966012 /NCGR_PEP_ID=MMETSP0108-20121206/38432_1 /TAXON_ID=195067 ORGANISM="Goniomonas pacifica, Strain CCMP1869" /NCGR_SAMPLE_ID=MMETSP0108 /ASSEMBLY_ACC=CAM_ASM_000204 /LENGTH=194 /DNA_ID=CAMNT_0017294161 /DNA_START=26 /DNA_END=607 /DNA_ORIENTATION=-
MSWLDQAVGFFEVHISQPGWEGGWERPTPGFPIPCEDPYQCTHMHDAVVEVKVRGVPVFVNCVNCDGAGHCWTKGGMERVRPSFAWCLECFPGKGEFDTLRDAEAAIQALEHQAEQVGRGPMEARLARFKALKKEAFLIGKGDRLFCKFMAGTTHQIRKERGWCWQERQLLEIRQRRRQRRNGWVELEMEKGRV